MSVLTEEHCYSVASCVNSTETMASLDLAEVQTEGVYDAFQETAYTLFGFFVTVVGISLLKRRGSKSQKSGPLRVSTKKNEQHYWSSVAAKIPREASQGAPVSISSISPTRNRGVPPHDHGYGHGLIDGDVLATTVLSGKAAQLSSLIDNSRSRALANGVDAAVLGEQSIHRVASALRACASRRCFPESLAVYDSQAKHIGEGSDVIWSLLLYSAVETKEFHRCEYFSRRLLNTGAISGNDFVNMVRYFAQMRHLPGLLDTLAELRKQGFVPDAICKNRAVAACCSVGALNLAETIADVTAFAGSVSMDTVGYNTLIKGHSSARDYARCFALYQKMKSTNISLSEVTYGIVLDACIESKDIEHANQIFGDLRASGLRVNVVHFTTFIKGLVNVGQVERATALLGEMRSSPNAKPDAVTYSTIIKAQSDRGMIAEAMHTLKEMLSQGITPDKIMFHHVLTCCCTTRMEPQRIFEVFEWLVGQGMQTTTTTLSILIKALAKTEAWTEALKLLDQAFTRHKLCPEPRLFVQLAQACVTAGNTVKALETYMALVRNAGSHGMAVDSSANMKLFRSCSIRGESAAAARIYYAVLAGNGYVAPDVLDNLVKLPA